MIYRGKCDLPRFREEELAGKLGEIVKNIHIPDPVLKRLQDSLTRDQARMRNERAAQRDHLEQRLAGVRRRMDQAYADKLDGKIPEDFWERKLSDWRGDEQQIQLAMAGLNDSSNGDRLLTAQRCLELANKAYSLYIRQNPAEQAKLLRMVLLELRDRRGK